MLKKTLYPWVNYINGKVFLYNDKKMTKLYKIITVEEWEKNEV